MQYLHFLLFIFLLLSPFGCKKAALVETAAQEEKLVRIAFRTDVRSFDPSIGIDEPSRFPLQMLFEGLTRTSSTGEVELAVAESYTLSEDDKTYTFHLRKTYWSNGDPVRAQDFAYAWMRIINPDKGNSLGAQSFYCIKNARAVMRKEKPPESVGIRALDDDTLQVELEYPSPYFLEILKTPSFFPINSRLDRDNPQWAMLEGDAFVCNGPFRLKHHYAEDEIVVLKNPSYWDEKHIQIPGIHISIIKDIFTQWRLFEKNQLDWLGKPVSMLSEDVVECLRKENKTHFAKSLCVCWLFLNVESFPFHNKKMRKAFAYAIDRKLLTQCVTQSNESPALGVLPDNISTQDGGFFKDNDIELACQLFEEGLEELGLSRETLPPITLNCAYSTRVAEVLQEQWRKALGVIVQIEKGNWPTFYDKLRKGNFQIGKMNWQSWIRDPIYILQTFRTKSDGVNMSQWESRQYQDLLLVAEKEADLGKRKAYFNQVEALLMEEMPVIPLYFYALAYAKNDRLENVYISDLGGFDLRWATFTCDHSQEQSVK